MKKMYSYLFLFSLCLFTFSLSSHEKSDLIIFSYNRPLQLYAFLESVETYVTGIRDIYLIYRADNEQFEAGYQETCAKCRLVKSVRQANDLNGDDFYDITMNIVKNYVSNYFMFAVDDMMVKDYIIIPKDIEELEKNKAYAFFYRLGVNLSRCYPLMKPDDPMSGYQKLPDLQRVNSDLCMWNFEGAEGDWNYPHTVDMALYRKEDVIACLSVLPHFRTPNQLESFWASKRPKVVAKGICFQLSKVVNIPLNRVQHDFDNRVMDSYTAEELLIFFQRGLKIDITPLHKIKNESAHMEYEPQFIQR